jgi:hypothetical protein
MSWLSYFFDFGVVGFGLPGGGLCPVRLSVNGGRFFGEIVGRLDMFPPFIFSATALVAKASSPALESGCPWLPAG